MNNKINDSDNYKKNTELLRWSVFEISAQQLIHY